MCLGEFIMSTIINIENLNKIYAGGFQALKDVNLQIHKEEIFALLGPNGAGKTTLISLICGLTNITSGSIRVDGLDIIKNYRETRKKIGLVPQELTTDAFETVWNTVSFSRGLFGLKKNDGYVEKVLKDLSLWDKRNQQLMTLSGGMKRRVLIAKALSHEPEILFLDEPTAGVDVELRKGMWALVRELRKSGVTIILTTHYIEEAEEMADRVGVINKGQLILTKGKSELMKDLGSKRLIVDLVQPIEELPDSLRRWDVQLQDKKLIYTFDPAKEDTGVAKIFHELELLNLSYNDVSTQQSSLEEIFVDIVRRS